MDVLPAPLEPSSVATWPSFEPQVDAVDGRDLAVADDQVRDLKRRHVLPPQVRLLHDRQRGRRVRRTFGDLLAEVHDEDVVAGVEHDPEVVLDQQLREAVVAQRLHDLGDLGALLAVHARDRLVEHQQLRLGRDRAGDLDPAARAVRQVVRVLAGDVRQVQRSSAASAASRALARGPSSAGRLPLRVRRRPSGRSRARSASAAGGSPGTCARRRGAATWNGVIGRDPRAVEA